MWVVLQKPKLFICTTLLTLILYQFFNMVLIWWYALSNESITRYIYTFFGKNDHKFLPKISYSPHRPMELKILSFRCHTMRAPMQSRCMDIILSFFVNIIEATRRAKCFTKHIKMVLNLSLFGAGEYVSAPMVMFTADDKDTTHDMIFVIHLLRPTPW